MAVGLVKLHLPHLLMSFMLTHLPLLMLLVMFTLCQAGCLEPPKGSSLDTMQMCPPCHQEPSFIPVLTQPITWTMKPLGLSKFLRLQLPAPRTLSLLLMLCLTAQAFLCPCRRLVRHRLHAFCLLHILLRLSTFPVWRYA